MKIWILALTMAASVASAQSRWPAGKVVFDDAETLQAKFDAGDFGINNPVDTDGDTYPDSIACGDYDGDGTLEIFDDVQGCVDALTDTGGRHIFVMPGLYQPPALTDCDEVGEACYDAIAPVMGSGGSGLIQLPSNTILECSGPRTTTLKSWDYPTDDTATSPAPEYSNITNADTSGNSNIVIRNCGIQGGGASTYTSASAGWDGSAINRGIQFYNVDDFIIDGNYCRNTHHACYFIESSRDGFITHNTAEEDGGYNDSNGGSQASFYIHTCSEFGAYDCPATNDDVSDITLIGNRVINAVGNAFNLRNDHGTTDASKNISIFDSYVRNNAGSCVVYRGQTNAHVSNITCDSTEGFTTSAGESSAYREGGNNYANVGSVLENAVLLNQPESASPMLNFTAYNDGTTVRNVVVDGTDESCMRVTQPQRNFVAEGVSLKNCGEAGFETSGSATNITEGMTIRDLVVMDVDQTGGPVSGGRFRGVSIAAALDYADIDGVTISGTTENPFYVNSASKDFVVRNVDITCTQPRYRGSFTEANAQSQACNTNALFDVMMVSNGVAGNCLNTSTTGTDQVFCACTSVQSIEGIALSGTDPVVVTITGHGYSNAEEVHISGIRGSTELNGNTYVVANSSTDTFELAGTDSSAVTAYESGGESGQWTAYNFVEEDGMRFQNTIDNAVIDGITGRICKNARTLGMVNVVTDTIVSNIVAIDDPAYYDGAADDPMQGAIVMSNSSSSNVTIDMSNVLCVDTDSAQDCLDLPGHSDHTSLSNRSSIIMPRNPIDATADTCDVACTGGSRCIDTDAAAGSVQWICEAGTYGAVK